MDSKIVKVELTLQTHKEFKMACLTNGQSIKDAMVELIHYYIENPKIELKNDNANK